MFDKLLKALVEEVRNLDEPGAKTATIGPRCVNGFVCDHSVRAHSHTTVTLFSLPTSQAESTARRHQPVACGLLVLLRER